MIHALGGADVANMWTCLTNFEGLVNWLVHVVRHLFSRNLLRNILVVTLKQWVVVEEHAVKAS